MTMDLANSTHLEPMTSPTLLISSQLQIAAVKFVLWCHADITAHAVKQRFNQSSAESEQQMTNPNWYT